MNRQYLLIGILIHILTIDVILSNRNGGDTTETIRSTLVADHSRKTHRTQIDQQPTIAQILNTIDDNIVDNTITHFVDDSSIFVDDHHRTLATSQLEDSSNKLNSIDSLTTITTPIDEIESSSPPRHQLCDSAHSGNSPDNFIWSESVDRLLRIIGNGVMKNGYNMFVAPGQVDGVATNVSVAVYIESMSSFRAQTMDFEVDMYLAMSWYDRRLAHTCTHPILIAHKYIADRIWHPDLYFVNSKFAYFQEVTTPNFMFVIYPDGLIFNSMRVDVTLSCMMDLKRFPMDRQECPLVMQSYAYVENIVNLSWHVEPPYFPIGSNSEIKLNDMVITNTKWESCSGSYPMFRGSGNWSCIRALIVMKRLVNFHLIQTYVPTAMLVLISFMSFFLDPRASPARISLTITTLLTLTTMSNGARQDLPQVSYVKAMDIWLSFCQGLIFLVLLEYTLVSFYITRREKHCEHRTALREARVPPTGSVVQVPCVGESNIGTSRICTNSSTTFDARMRRTSSGFDHEHRALMSATGPPGMQQIIGKYNMTKPCQICANIHERIAKRIDRNSRWIFPLVFSAFCSAYWFIFLWYSTDD